MHSFLQSVILRNIILKITLGDIEMITCISNPRDYWSFWSHFIGALLSVAATVFLMLLHTKDHQWSFLVFGLSLIALYACSSIYHYNQGPPERVQRLRKLDHSMIYVLIAGTYTPILVNCMEGSRGFIWLIAIWGAALLGIIIKVCWLNAPRWLYTSIYLIMGWAIVFQMGVLSVTTEFIVWMVVGGILYSAGAILYIIKRPNIFKTFGFHEIFHIFIIFGSVSHFIAINVYI